MRIAYLFVVLLILAVMSRFTCGGFRRDFIVLRWRHIRAQDDSQYPLRGINGRKRRSLASLCGQSEAVTLRGSKRTHSLGALSLGQHEPVRVLHVCRDEPRRLARYSDCDMCPPRV